jgi:gliding motility-associated-like protein
MDNFYSNCALRSRLGRIRFFVLFALFLTFYEVSYSEGTKELCPSSSDRALLIINSRDYGYFAKYGSQDHQRLYINIAEPSQEKVYIGFSRPVSGSHYPLNGEPIDAYFRILDPSGNIVYPVRGSSAGQLIGDGNIDSYDKAKRGPSALKGGGYSAWVFNPAGLAAGDYYIEFSTSASEYNSNSIYIEYFDITVGKGNKAIDGRLFSKMWAISTPAYEWGGWFDRPFNGKVYGYCEDYDENGGYVAEINFRNSGFYGASFNLAFNSSGTAKTDNFSINRRSVQGEKKLSPEYKIFLNEPDEKSFPSADFGEVLYGNEYPKLFGCRGNYFFKVSVDKKGRVEVIIDFDGNDKYDPNTRDVLLIGLVEPREGETAPFIRDIPWNGLDGFGNVVNEESEVRTSFEFVQATFHFPMYDVEYLRTGFIPKTIRPKTPTPFQVKVYWDDTNITNGSIGTGLNRVELNGVTAPSHYWDDINYGNINSINTYWDSYKVGRFDNYSFFPPMVDCEVYVPGAIDGIVFNDINRNGKRDTGEGGLKDYTVKLFIDDNKDGIVQPVEQEAYSVTTNSLGEYRFLPEVGKEYIARVELSGTSILTSSNDLSVPMLTKGVMHANVDFGFSDYPVVNISVDKESITETDGTAVISAELSYPAVEDVIVNLNFTGTVSETDFSSTKKVISIPKGETKSVITITSVSDLIDEDDEVIEVSVASLENAKKGDNNIINVTIADDDDAGITVSKETVVVEESGKNDSFTVVLTSQPNSDVTINISSADINQVKVENVPLVFSSENWNIPQTVNVSSKDDYIDDDNQKVNIIISEAVSEDDKYAGIDPADILADDIDNDEAGVLLSKNTVLVSEEEEFDIFTVKLSSQPQGNVTIEISIDNPAEAIAEYSALVFNNENWNVPQPVKIVGVDELIDDGDKNFNINLNPEKSTDTKYKLLPQILVVGVNTDNDNFGLDVSESVVEVAENGTISTFVVKLKSQPVNDVVVKFASSDITEGEVNPESIIFNSTNWNTGKIITVTGVDDFIDDDDKDFKVSIDLSESVDKIYKTIPLSYVDVVNIDDDEVGIILSQNNIIISEDKTVSSVKVKLRTEPEADVIISVLSTDLSEGEILTKGIVFTKDNWNEFVNIDIKGVDDFSIDGDIEFVATLGSQNSKDLKYKEIDTEDITVINQDNDIAGIQVSKKSITVSETGDTDTFEVKLISQPNDIVRITVTLSDDTEGNAQKKTLEFNPDNWDKYQTVVIEGADDNIVDGNQLFNVFVNPSQSSDKNYNKLPERIVRATNIDDDVPGLIMSENSFIVDEDGTTDQISIKLKSAPTEDVIISVNVSDNNEISVSESKITFTPENWNIAQVINIIGVDEDIDDDDKSVDIILKSEESSDPYYKVMQPVNISGVCGDNDTAGLILSKDNVKVSETGLTDQFTVKLASKPDNDVTVSITVSDESEATTTVKTLTYTPDDWNMPKAIPVVGVDDMIVDKTQEFRIDLTTSSDDDKYSELEKTEVTGTAIDNDIAGVIISKDIVSVKETGNQDFFDIKLSSEPEKEVVLTISVIDRSEGDILVSEYTFDANNWNQNQRVNIIGVNDNIDDDNQEFDIIIDPKKSTDAEYKKLENSKVKGVCIDNDEAEIIVSKEYLQVSESGTEAIYTVVLATEPQLKVNIAIEADDATEGNILNKKIVFTAKNWNRPQQVRLKGVDDSDIDGTINFKIVNDPSTSEDKKYKVLENITVSADNLDNDESGIVLDKTSIVVEEEGEKEGRVEISLSSRPTDNVVLTFENGNEDEGDLQTSSITFTPDNWNIKQSVVFKAKDDSVDDGDIDFDLQTKITTLDSNYTTVEPPVIQVTTIDNDEAMIIISKQELVVKEEGETTDSYSVKLSTEPVGNVVINIESLMPSEAKPDKTSLTFTQFNWNSEQIVNVKSVDELIDDGDKEFDMLISSSESADAKYREQKSKRVKVTNIDNDIAGIVVSEISNDTKEDGTSATFRISLSTKPLANVNIALKSDNTDEGVLNISDVTIGVDDWETGVTVTVIGVNDNKFDEDKLYHILTEIANSSDPVYDGINPDDVNVVNINMMSVNDTDGDGISDQDEGTDDIDNDGKPNYNDTDSDGDDIPDRTEGVDDSDSDGKPDYKDTDSDGDKIPDSEEGTNDNDGDGKPNYLDLDSDGDEIPDSNETSKDFDNDGTPNYLDLDSDDDTIPDSTEGEIDTDSDNQPDYLDLDSDGDEIPDEDEGTDDVDGDNIPSYIDTDSDGDGIPDNTEGLDDEDNDGTSNYKDTDSDGDGIDDETEGVSDFDGDGKPNYLDLDSDGDKIPDSTEGETDYDGDGKPNYLDLDSDGDGIKDETEGVTDFDDDGKPNCLDEDSDGDGIDDETEGVSDFDGDNNPNYLDLDSDDDGLSDELEGENDNDSDSKPDYLDLDSDNDSIPDSEEGADDIDNDGEPNYLDPDSDNDGIDDNTEGAIDTDGDGIPNYKDTDSDNDGITDEEEKNIDFDNDGIPNYIDLDSDSDGIADEEEGTEDIDSDGAPNYLDIDTDGDGIADEEEGITDTDSDGLPDYRDLDSDNDNIPDKDEGREDTDGDGKPDYKDLDSDEDGIPDIDETIEDTDKDGISDYRDLDSDNDGISDKDEGNIDSDGDYIPNYKDLDSDNDGIPDSEEGITDIDEDGIPNYLDKDSDGDGIPDETEGTSDEDSDGIPNYLDIDSDGDGITDNEEGDIDTDKDGTPNFLDKDSDGDGITDKDETDSDFDGDGKPNYIDSDSDSDGIKDKTEGDSDNDGDGAPNYLDVDSDGDGISDEEEGDNDEDSDGTPNFLDLDSDDDGMQDEDEGTDDSDNDGLPNFLDTDSDGDDITDEEEGDIDSDDDGTPNYLDLDSDNDGIPDREEGDDDADNDGTPNYLDLDSDGDGMKDEDEGTEDSDGDGTPDFLDPDSDGDGIPDKTEGDGDSDKDGIPDYLDLDSDGDGISDSEEGDEDMDEDGTPNYLDDDSDGDGLTDRDEGNGDCDNDGNINSLDTDSCDTDREIPDGFSPNGDGVNDFFTIVGLDKYERLEIVIFNRWGSIVYSDDNYNNKWDGYANVKLSLGEQLPNGTYYYVLTIKDTGEVIKGYVYMNK